MAPLGPGPHRSGDIADVLERKVTSVAPLRNQLIAKGMIWSPHHGDTASHSAVFPAKSLWPKRPSPRGDFEPTSATAPAPE